MSPARSSSSVSFTLGADMSDQTNNFGSWVCIAVAIILFGLLMGLRTHFHSAWLRAGTAGVAFVILFGAVTQFRKGKAARGTQQGASPNGGPAKPHGDSGATGGPPSVS
jgi:hypothetical protein